MKRVVMIICSLLIVSVSNAAWEIQTYPTDEIRPSSTFGTGGVKNGSTSASIELYEHNGAANTFLCSHSVDFEPASWSQDFDPSEDYEQDWPDTGGVATGSHYLYLSLKEGTEERDTQNIETKDIP